MNSWFTALLLFLILLMVAAALEIQQFSGYSFWIRIFVTLAIYFLVWVAVWVRPTEKKPIEDKSRAPMVLSPTLGLELPGLKLSLLGMQTMIPDFNKSMTGIILAVRIKNAGAPSRATDWALEVRLPDGKPVKSSIAAISGIKSDKPRFNPLSGADLNVVTNVIETGGVEQGELMFYAEVEDKVFNSPDTVIVLSAEDISGRRFITEQRLGDWIRQTLKQ